MNNVVELEVYQRSLHFSNRIWEIYIKWDYFARDTIGKQLVRASDSVSANLAEGKGRYSTKEKLHFCYYARGSIEEVKDWIRKTESRKLISEKERSNLKSELTIIAKQLNAYINSLKRKSTK